MLPLVRAESGELMEIIRSDRPGLALALAKKALRENKDPDLVPGMVRKMGGKYRHVGYLGRDPATGRSAVCNSQGIELGPLVPGDSFVSKCPESRDEQDEREAVAAEGDP